MKFARICFHGVTIIIIVQQKIKKSIEAQNIFPSTTVKYDENENETVKKNGKVL